MIVAPSDSEHVHDFGNGVRFGSADLSPYRIGSGTGRILTTSFAVGTVLVCDECGDGFVVDRVHSIHGYAPPRIRPETRRERRQRKRAST